MDPLEIAIGETKALLQPLFTKPTLSTKLLEKPPFRFIHDIVVATLNSTGFPNGFFTPEELDSSKFKDDKTAKMSFLNKLIQLVNVGNGSAVDVSSLQIVAGLEPLNTNRLLKTFGRIALDETIDRNHLVQHCLNGKGIDEFHRKLNMPSPMLPENPPPNEETVEASNANDKQSLAERIQKCNDNVEQTRTMISKLIDKPKCTDALLGKPPFRFIHDIITEIGRSTQFDLCRIFSADELVSSNVTEKETKIFFLQALITFLERCLETQINVKPAKIVAGLDPERTRYLLQVFTVVATMRIEEPSSIATQGDKHPDLDQQKHQESPGKGLDYIDNTPVKLNRFAKARAIEVQLKVLGEAPFAPSLANLNARPTTARGARPNVIKQREIESSKGTDVVRPAADIIKEVGCEFEGMTGAMLDIVADYEPLVERIKGCNDGVDQTRPTKNVVCAEPLVKGIKGCDDGVDKNRATIDATNYQSFVKQIGVDQTQTTITKLIYKPLPAQLSDIDFASLAKAIRDIAHSTTSMAKHVSSIPDNVEKLTKQRSHWLAEENRYSQTLACRAESRKRN